MKLQIDFITQQSNAIRNDCGAACIAMVAGTSIDKALAAGHTKPGQPMHMTAIVDALTAYRLPHDYVRPLHLPHIRESLARGWPVIALVNYGRLPDGLKATDYDGNHYVVVTGFLRDAFLVHDPLWPDQRGAWVRWPDVVLGEALANPTDAQPMQGIVVRQEREISQPDMGELGLVVSTALAHGTVAVYLEQLYQAMEIAPGPLAERQGHALARVQVWKAGEK